MTQIELFLYHEAKTTFPYSMNLGFVSLNIPIGLFESFILTKFHKTSLYKPSFSFVEILIPFVIFELLSNPTVIAQSRFIEMKVKGKSDFL